jgi:hypothetical protein
MPTVLFDEAHGELIRSAPPPSEDIDTWTALRTTLENAGWQTSSFIGDSQVLNQHILRTCNVFFIGSPTTDFLDVEISAIEGFVQEGGGLLVAIDAESLWRLPKSRLILALADWGFQFTRYLLLPPENVHTFRPHCIAAGIKQVSVADLNSISISEKITPLVLITERGPIFAACGEVGKGRVLAIGDYALFADAYIAENDNEAFSLRTFKWLAFENSIDVREVKCEAEIALGRSSTFSIVVSNPRMERIGRVRGTLLSSAGATIEPDGPIVRAIPPGGQTWLLWTVEPKQLGLQLLHLSLDLPKTSSDQHLCFDPVVSFKCIAPIVPSLQTFLDPACTCPREIVAVEQPFWAEAKVEWESGIPRATLTLELLSDDEHVQVTPLPQVEGLWRWQLVAILPGTYRLALRVEETDQYITQLIEVKPSLNYHIETVMRDIVEPLDDRIRRLALRLRGEFGDEPITSLPFSLYSPETFIRELFPEPARLRLLEVLNAARQEKHLNQPLLRQLLVDVSPVYMPGRGAFVPFDPWLAAHLKDVYALEWESIVQNLVYAEGMPTEWLEQNLAAYLIHEKYGHGFFFVHTRLGQQLAILFESGFLRKADIECLKTPYPREQFARYREAIQATADSSIILNEGFAAWLETCILKKLGEIAGQAAYRREVQLTRMDSALKGVERDSAYFAYFTPPLDSRYAEGLEYFRLIEGYFGEDYGPKCAVQVALKAADVRLGITQSDDIVQFALTPEEMLHALLKEEKDHARSDMRLRHIHAVLREQQSRIQSEQENLMCHRTCLHPSCPVNAIIAQKLGW